MGYASKNVKSNADLAKEPYYLTMEWDTPQSKVSTFKMWSNYKGNQNPTKMDIEMKDETTNEWKVIEADWEPEWKDESGGDKLCSVNITFDQELVDVTGLRIRIKEANFNWGKIAVRELEVFEDFSDKISISNPTDYVANIKYNGNELNKVIFEGKELKENLDYKLTGNNNSQITVFGKTLIANGVNSGAKLELVFSQGKSYVERLVIWDNWKTHLESLVSKAEEADNSVYTEKSLDELVPVIKEAKDLLAKENVTDDEYDQMSTKLQEAINKLVLLIDGTKKIEFEDANSYASGLQFKENDGGIIAGNTYSGAWFQYDGVKFGDNEPNQITLRYAASDDCAPESRIEIRLDGVDGELIATVDTPSTGGWNNYVTITSIIDKEQAAKLKGTHPICLVLKGAKENASIADLNWISFDQIKVVDKTELNNAIDEIEALNPSMYTKDSWDRLQKELESAKALSIKEDATQDEVNKAVTQLKDAQDQLIFVGDKTDLDTAIKEAEALDSSKYTSKSWDDLQKALEEAKKVLIDENATTDTVNLALTGLKNAQSNLELLGDKTELNKMIKEVKALDQSKYTKASWKVLQESLAKAEAVVANKDASQKDVDLALKELKDAKGQLIKIANKTELNKLIKEVESLDKSKYTSASWKKMQDALTKAKVVASNDGASQKEVDVALKELQTAKEGLIKLANKTELNKLIKEVEGLDKSQYTKASWEKMMSILKKEKEVSNNENASQTDVDNALKSLNEAKEQLVLADNKDEDVLGENIDNTTDNSKSGSNSNTVKSADNTPLFWVLSLMLLSSGAIFLFKKKSI